MQSPGWLIHINFHNMFIYINHPPLWMLNDRSTGTYDCNLIFYYVLNLVCEIPADGRDAATRRSGVKEYTDSRHMYICSVL